MRETVQVRFSDYGRGCSLNVLRANTLTTRHVMFRIKKTCHFSLSICACMQFHVLEKTKFQKQTYSTEFEDPA